MNQARVAPASGIGRRATHVRARVGGGVRRDDVRVHPRGGAPLERGRLGGGRGPEQLELAQRPCGDDAAAQRLVDVLEGHDLRRHVLHHAFGGAAWNSSK